LIVGGLFLNHGITHDEDGWNKCVETDFISKYVFPDGELDWVYTEELDLRSAYAWSPDSRYIAFLQFDERPVQTFPLIDYLEQRPTVYDEKYPTAGSPNPIVRLGVFDVETGKLVWMPLAGTADTYLVRFGWLPQGDRVYGEVLNRAQTNLQLASCNPDSGETRTLKWVPEAPGVFPFYCTDFCSKSIPTSLP
ncbi:MAG: hypothetical protein B7X10_03755, partial [Burkholderiales bacterium 21-58-4]